MYILGIRSMGRFNEHVVAKIEKELQVKLPDSYKGILLKYPFPSDSDAAYYDFYGDPEVILEDNKYYRDNGFNGHPWQVQHFIIGNDGSGDIFFIDLENDDGQVLRAHQNSGTEKLLLIQEAAEDIYQFVEQIQERSEEFEEAEPDDLEETKRMKKRNDPWE